VTVVVAQPARSAAAHSCLVLVLLLVHMPRPHCQRRRPCCLSPRQPRLYTPEGNARKSHNVIRRYLHCSTALRTSAERHRHRAGGISAPEAFFMRKWSVGMCVSKHVLESETEGRSGKKGGEEGGEQKGAGRTV
jgi:hypothetical protein